jgi:glucose/arabinose dehydrogenase
MKRSRLAQRGVVTGVLALLVTVAVTFAHPSPASASTALPTGFTDAEWVSGIARPYQMEFAPDGRLFVSQQGGKLRVIKNGALLATPFVTLSVDAHGDRGLIGIAFDPAFSVNHFVYVYYTAPTPVPHSRVSRFTAAGDVAVAGSEKILIELANLGTETVHNGGSIHFGADGKLYIATGDNAQGTLSQSMTSLLGKMLRLNSDGTIPADNPFATTATGTFRAIWALGLRNPYTFGVQPGTGRILINDVGAMTWEEIDDGASGANYGWPTTEGPTTDPRFKGPLFAYNHGSTATTGCAIAGGTFYNPAVQQFPSSYVGKYFFADACSGWIRMINPSGVAEPFLSGGDGLVDVKTGPDGSLYYLARLDGAGNPGIVHKVTFSGKPAISSPPANITVAPGQPATFTVVANGAAPLSYQWQRGGVDIAGARSASYTLQAPTLADSGAQFRVVVTNSLGSATSAIATLTVTNNRPPKGTILTPAVGTHYNAGAKITFTASATDPEDGTLPASAFAWEIIFHHNTHTHPGPGIGPGPTGNARSGTFVIPNTGETSTDVFYRIDLIVTDSGGQSSESFVDVLPHTATLTFAATPTSANDGLQILLDGQPHLTPYSEESVVSMKRTLDVVSPQLVGTTTYTFSAWSDGGASNHRINTPNVATTYTAAFVPVAGGDTTAPVVSVTAPVGGDVVSGTTTLSASASDNVGVTQVKWYVDAVEVAHDSAGPPWSHPWTTTSVADGTHKIFVKARDAAGNWGASRVVAFTVDNP